MDRLRIPKNQRMVHTVSGKLKRFAAILIALCFVFLCSCAKNNASTVEVSGMTSVEETSHTSEKVDLQTTSYPSEIVSTTAKDETAKVSSSKENPSSDVSKASSEKNKSEKVKKTTSNTITTTTLNQKSCCLTIECKTVLKNENFKKLDSAKQSVVPSDGVILKKTKVVFDEGESVYDIFKRVCQNNVCSHNCKYCQGRIQFESVPSVYGTYIRGIHFLYEKDCGTKSGWMYKVNDIFPEKAVDLYYVKENDNIVLVYSCDMNDV